MSGQVGRAPHQTPYRRTYANGHVVWVARFYDRAGKARYAKPRWHGYKATFARKRDAQRAIDEALERLYQGAQRPRGVGEYFRSWVDRHPRSERTNKTNTDRISSALDVEIDGLPLRDWEFDELRRRHALALVDHMLRVQGRAAQGVRGIISACSAMAEDAITDEVCDLNPFKGIRIRANDQGRRRSPAQIRVFTFEEMHRFAKAAGRYEAMVRVFTDTGLRLGEVLPLRRDDFDGEKLQVRRTAHEGRILEGTKTDHGEPDAGRIVPVPATLAWMLEAQINLNDPDCELIFTTPRGRLSRYPPPRVPP